MKQQLLEQRLKNAVAAARLAMGRYDAADEKHGRDFLVRAIRLMEGDETKDTERK